MSYLPDLGGTQGVLRQKDTMDGTQVVSSEVHTSTVTLTATRSTPATGGQDLSAYMTTETESQTRTWIAATGSWRWTDKQTSYNSYGLATQVVDLGDTSTGADDTCTSTTYVTPDTTKWMIDFPAQEITTDCASNVGDGDYVSGSQTFYDGSSVNGATPGQGLSTKTSQLVSVSGGTLNWKQKNRTDYDTNGRSVATYDALDNKTSTAYTPAAGGAVTQTVVTNPMGWSTTTRLDPGKGLNATMSDVNGKLVTTVYDALGRLTEVWLNNRPTTATPDLQYTYLESATAPAWVETQKLGPQGNQIQSYDIYDGFMRLRQNQTTAPVANGGRNINDTNYDSRGLKARTSQLWNNASGPSGTLATFTAAAVPVQHQYTYDNLERQTVDAFVSAGTAEWQTTTAFDGDRGSVTPPSGGTPLRTMVDAEGRKTELDQYHGSTASGAYDAATYRYDRAGNLVGYADPAGNQWSWTYDLQGRKLTETDPDSGKTTYSYDDAGNVVSTSNAAGVTIVITYDALGRKTTENLTSSSGPLLHSWTFDTFAKGQLASATTYQGSDAYTTSVTGYDDAYRPLGNSVTIPASEGSALAGTWTTTMTYNPDWSIASITEPAAGGLASETIALGYDANGYLLNAAGVDQYIASSTYQPWGDLYQHTLGASGKRVQITTDEYADTHRAKTIQVATEDQTTTGQFDEVQTEQYNWAPSGRLASIDTQHAGATTSSECYSYDYLNQLTSAWTTAPSAGGCAAAASPSTVTGPAPYWTDYSYDLSSNRTGMTQHGVNGGIDTSTTYTYPAAGLHGAHTLASTNTAGGTSNTYTYNNAGQTTNATVNGISDDFTWTAEGKLAGTTLHSAGGDQVSSYVYDAKGNELIRRDPTAKTLFLGDTEITTDATGSAVHSATRFYTFGGTLIASRNSPGTLTWLANDDQATAQVAIDQATLQVTVRRQDPFGNARGTTAWVNDRTFVGGNTEPNGLVHLGARMYDPSTGRFISDDSVTDTSDPQQMNGYSYANNDPTTSSDPTGQDPTGATNGSTAAHDTAVALRVLDLEQKYGADSEIQPDYSSGNNGAADLICWNCAAKDGLSSSVVYVWTVKPEGRESEAKAALATGIRWVESDTYCIVNKCTAMPGPMFETPNASAVIGMPDQTIEVHSYVSGIEVYRTTQHSQNLARSDPRREKAETASEHARDHVRKMDQKKASRDAVRNDAAGNLVVTAVLTALIAVLIEAFTEVLMALFGRSLARQVVAGATAACKAASRVFPIPCP